MKQEVTKRLPAKKSTSTKLNHQCSVIATLQYRNKYKGKRWHRRMHLN